MMLERSGRLRIGRVFSALGDWSYSIYLSHAIVIQLVSHLIYRWVANLWYGILIIDAVALPVVIFVGYVSYTVIERPMMRLLYKGFRRRPLLEAVAGAR
jgi:exopolysaccharide production protein ExoZ